MPKNNLIDKHIIFSHGLHSSPWGRKITALSQVATKMGWSYDSIDYRNMPNPDERAQKLIDHLPQANCLVLVGSSAGAYVATVASEHANNLNGLFLMAPAFYMQINGHPAGEERDPVPHAKYTHILHGWNDDVVPVQNALTFAQKHKTSIEIFNSDHNLIDVLDQIEDRFTHFLARVSKT